MEALYSDYHPRFIYVDKYRFSSKWVYPSSSVPYGLLRYILSGTAVFELDGKKFEVGPDDVFYIPQGSNLTCAAHEEFCFISIRFIGSILSQGTDLLQTLWHIPCQTSFAGQPEMKHWFEACYASAVSHENFKMLEIRGYLNLIVAGLARAVADNFGQDTTAEEDRRHMEALFDVESIQRRALKSVQKNNDPRITAILDYITSHPDQNLTHAEMCRMADVSESTLRRLFKAKTGKTIYEFTKETKMVNAARRLMSTNQSIATISYELGYEIPSYFSQSFKEVFGVTPQEYRKVSHDS